MLDISSALNSGDPHRSVSNATSEIFCVDSRSTSLYGIPNGKVTFLPSDEELKKLTYLSRQGLRIVAS